MFLSLIKSTKHLSLKPSLSSMKILSRNISLSGVNRLKEIKVTENEKTITIEAVKRRSDRIDNLVTSHSSSHKDSCPLCRLNLRRLNYTDVLILHQFVESNGKLMPQKMTGLCNRSYNTVRNLVLKAQRCQLMPRPADYQSYGPWDELNTYYEYPVRYRDQPMRIIKQEFWEVIKNCLLFTTL